MKKTLVIGWDGASWDYINPVRARGELPNLQRLIDEGTWGVLRSTIPAMTPTAWASISTGKNPGKHGIFDMKIRRPNSYQFDLVDASHRSGTPVWEWLNKSGVKTGLVNVPFAHPVDEIDGFLVSGFGASMHDEGLILPYELAQIVDSNHPNYRPDVDLTHDDQTDVNKIFQVEQEHQRSFLTIAKTSLEHFPVDVLIINLMLLDHVNHFTASQENLNEAVKQMDSDLGTLLECFRAENVLVISDHGSRRVDGSFLLYPWLRDMGYCQQYPRPIDDRPPIINWILSQWLKEKFNLRGVPEHVIRSVFREIIQRLRPRYSDTIWEHTSEVVPFAKEMVTTTEQTDTGKSWLLPGSSYSGVLYFNILGRDPEGLLPNEEKAELANTIRDQLSKISDPLTDQEIVSNAYLSTEIYQGPFTERAPDLILDTYSSRFGVLTNDYRQYSIRSVTGSKYLISNNERNDDGRHSMNGIFVFSGDDFASRGKQMIGSVMDIPATLLHIYNIPIPDDFDGQVLLETLDREGLGGVPVAYQPGDVYWQNPLTTRNLDGIEEVEQRLRDLGYL